MSYWYSYPYSYDGYSFLGLCQDIVEFI
ncbi:hypothetical protein ANOM_011852 [Aspergillus nomiae NRRL 13137]|uniref:Uncharacterized protein n=1 Tax=Aspergillus nomiae NRRL (strain ATCC 15546 / NRRL 13137 / CBS 260.88 / M93) TaxID=1509407 RepID=A0A0L1IJQ1_ASPN3|nr:hypothetical protein ANOM_011852 [Aspergillus nomiae NRRL 13137]